MPIRYKLALSLNEYRVWHHPTSDGSSLSESIKVVISVG